MGHDGWRGLEFGTYLPLEKDRIRSSWVVLFLLIILALLILQQVRLWLISFTWGQALLKGRECSGMFQNGSFSLLPGRLRGFLFHIYCGSLVKLLVVNLTVLMTKSSLSVYFTSYLNNWSSNFPTQRRFLWRFLLWLSGKPRLPVSVFSQT